jgi:TB2/DP1, HVA22 family
MNDIINRFEANENDKDIADSLGCKNKSKIRKFKMQDEKLSLVKFTERQNLFLSDVRQRAITMDGFKEIMKQLLIRLSHLLEMISNFPFPKMSVMSVGLTSLFLIFIAPRGFTERVLYPGFRLILTILYPAYRSFKAVRNKNLKEYLKWIIFWIIYAFFTCLELVTDALLMWFPFYYEMKILFWIYILGPTTRGSMKIYKHCIHSFLISYEEVIFFCLFKNLYMHILCIIGYR